MTTTSTTPNWLATRRERAAVALGAIEMPSFRGTPGWEFTPIDKLDLDAYPAAPGGDGAALFDFDDAVGASSDEHAVEGPIVLSTVQEQAGTTLHWRALVVLEESASAEVWHESRSADPQADGVLNGVVELVVGQNARLRFVDAQDVSEKAWVFGAQRATVARDASLDWITLGFGSANGKVFQETQLAGPGAHGTVTGAYASRGRQHLDFDTLQEHAAPDTTSDLAFRGILADRSHAAAIAQIDRDQLFYLRAHGLPEPDANRLVIEGFLQALVERFEEGPVRERVAGAIGRRLETVLGR